MKIDCEDSVRQLEGIGLFSVTSWSFFEQIEILFGARIGVWSDRGIASTLIYIGDDP